MRQLALVLALAACNDTGKRARIDVPVAEPVASPVQVTKHEPPPPAKISELVERGRYWRLDTKHGPVHVWMPKGYDARRAETIVYIHGYYLHVDDAWTKYELASKFAASAINALFIACEAPAGYAEPVVWESLQPLLDTVQQGIGEPWPKRRIVAFGHSAAYRTLLGWLDEPALDTVVLLDAAYGDIDQYKTWVDASDRHRLIDVGDDTREWTDKLHAELPDSVVIDGFPTVDEGIPKAAARARVLYIKSSLGHFPLVENKTAIPMILRTLRARTLLREPLAQILATP